MKKFIIFVLSFTFIIQAFVFRGSAAFTDSLELDSNIAYLVSVDDSESIIYDKNSTIRCNPGELVKIVTAILVLESDVSLSQNVTASANAAF